MKLEVKLKTEYDNEYFKRASLFHALDHIKNEIQLDKAAGSVDSRSKGYGMDWKLEDKQKNN